MSEETDEPEPVRLILFSGLAADADVFIPQKLAFPRLKVPAWPVPEANDTLDSYARRMAEALGPPGRMVIGGMSFGGIISLYAATYLDPLAVVLIGSVESPAELPCWLRLMRPLRPLLRFFPVRLMQFFLRPLASKFVRDRWPRWGGLARQFRDCEPAVLKWSLARMLDWETAPQLSCPVLRIHGDWDCVLPGPETADTIIPGAGHLISLTHPTQVNDFLRKVLHDAALRPVVE
ncbi:alpha/beta fold hydrolase [Lignipirellula cremea]|uniref:Alpha/beta hydrolase family protein n=1 Tax=Lignipirellula cremea TaxID=2528010 RepID=A0A518DZ87_9BACT|nr:alpha/beta hydrolase [Lignipirellula cremea]QDU97160.1 Alpha/beta hydrolase family protein [Lignipirellula cremea]